MATSEAGICNRALTAARHDRRIESLDEGSTEAILCSDHYADTRDLVLSAADWPFARKRLLLAQTGTPPPEWAYSYTYPTDCITARGVQDGMRVRRFDEQVKYDIENAGNGESLLIYMDVPDAVLVYTMRAVHPAIYPPAFSQALAYKLASVIARSLDKGEQTCDRLMQVAEAMIGQAAARCANEVTSEVPPQSEHFTVRTSG